MMKRLFWFFVLSSFAVCFPANGRVGLIMNGSFEKDGQSIPDITLEAPTFWCDVVVPSGKFKAKVTDVWSTHDIQEPGFSLEIRSQLSSISKGDTASVSQQVYFEQDVNSLSFDVWLSALGFMDWDPAERTALVMIDGQIIWDSNDLPIDQDGDFLGTVVIGSEAFSEFLDDNWHDLTLAMRSNISGFPYDLYASRWDFIKFDKYCGGLGFLDADLNQDCYVNLADLAVLGLSWMEKPASAKDDLNEDGIVDKTDLGLFAEDWLYNTDWKNWGQAGNFEMEKLECDFDLSGQIDLGDLMMLSEYWQKDSKCNGLELSGDDVINFEDFAVFAQQWGWRDWLYYVE